MEDMQGLRLARAAPNGENRSACGVGARSANLPASRMENYAEIFGGFAASCSIPVLVLPKAMNGYEEELAGSQNSGLNYLDIFGGIDAGSFSLSYEELLPMEKGSNEKDKEDDSSGFLDEMDVGQVKTGPPDLPTEVPVSGRITFSKVNQISSSFHLKFDADKTNQQSIVDEAETTSLTGFVEDDSSRNVASDDHILSGYMTEEKEGGNQREILNRCFVGATVDGSENDLNDAHMPPSEGAAYDSKKDSHTSYHATSSRDIPLSDHSFLTILDINLHTQPLEVPPPLRAPPRFSMKQGMNKSEAFEAPNITFSRNYQASHAGGPRTRHALKETVKNTSICSNVEVDASKAAAASAAAMIEAMEQAQASLKSAKKLMERKRDSPQNDRRLGPRVTSLLFEEDEEEIQEKESGSYKLSDEKDRSHEWKIDEQFYELVNSEKEKYNSDEDIQFDHRFDAYQYIPDKEPCGLQGQRTLHGGDKNEDDDKVETLNTIKINETKMFSGGEFQIHDGNAKGLKPGIITDKEEAMNIFESSAMSCLQRDVEGKQKIGGALPVPNEDIQKVVDTISLIQLDRNESELKQCQESCVCAEPDARGRNGSGLVSFCMDRKLEEFDGGEALEEMLEQVKETHLHTSDMKDISETSVVFEYDAFRSDVGMVHPKKEDNCNITSEFGIINKFKETKLSSLQNANEVEVDTEHQASFSCEKNMEATREECQLGTLNQTKNESYDSYNDGKDSEVEAIDNTSEQENSIFSSIDKIIEPVKKERAKWNIPNRSELNVAKLFVQPVCLEKAKEALDFQQNEEKNVYELPQKFEYYEGRLTANGEQRKDEVLFFEKVQTDLELKKKIMGLNATQEVSTQQVFQRIRVQNSKVVLRANSLNNKGNNASPFVDSCGSSWKQMEKTKPDKWRDVSDISKEILNGERNEEAEQKRKLEEKERAREREKDMIAVEKVPREDCERVFTEARERPDIVLERVAAEARHRPITSYRDITEKASAEAFERSEMVVNEPNLQAEHAAVERAITEARERAIERALAEQASLVTRKQAERSGNVSNDKNWKYNEAEGISRPDNKDNNNNLKPSADVHDAPNDKKSQSEACEGESPLRCKARQERCQRIVERAANALAEKNMRDLLAQREQAERNRFAESLDVEVRRWSTGKEGNLRALLSTLQYILGHDSGWQPIPLTEVITATAVRKAYRKATLYVHPDKLQQRGATIQHKYICEKVFDLLKDGWNKFNSEG